MLRAAPVSRQDQPIVACHRAYAIDSSIPRWSTCHLAKRHNLLGEVSRFCDKSSENRERTTYPYMHRLHRGRYREAYRVGQVTRVVRMRKRYDCRRCGSRVALHRFCLARARVCACARPIWRKRRFRGVYERNRHHVPRRGGARLRRRFDCESNDRELRDHLAIRGNCKLLHCK